MSTPIETKIFECLLLAIAKMSQGFDVAITGDGYVPSDDPFLSVAEVLAPSERQYISEGKPHLHSGVIAAVLRTPVGSDFDYRKARNDAAVIASRLSESSRFRFQGACVRISERPYIGTGYRDGGWYHQPINVSWECQG